jgi:hypothetical protein
MSVLHRFGPPNGAPDEGLRVILAPVACLELRKAKSQTVPRSAGSRSGLLDGTSAFSTAHPKLKVRSQRGNRPGL